MKFVRRVCDKEIVDSALLSEGGNRCPDLWELDNGDFVAIGKDLTKSIKSRLPSNVEVGSDEKAILIPKIVLKSAKQNL